LSKLNNHENFIFEHTHSSHSLNAPNYRKHNISHFNFLTLPIHHYAAQNVVKVKNFTQTHPSLSDISPYRICYMKKVQSLHG